MEHFYKIEIQTKPDGSTAVGATATYDNGMDAEIAFLTNCASALSAVKNGTLKAALIKIIGSSGADIMTKFYSAEKE